tara:strand:+ start:1147 stop:1467 length:321 start_codon:yes stop_codon:yes gene_type:complete
MKFVNLLSTVNYPTSNQQKQELWDVEGIIKKHSNQKFKFDLRPLKNNIKKGFFKTKADKMVFDIKDQYIVVDVEELHEYLKDKELKMVYLEELISKLDWNIILLKI